MTNEERAQIAIDAMKYFKQILYNGIYGEFVGNFDTAISALEKQISKKPLNIEETKYKVSYKCPVCRTLHVNNWCGTEWKLPFCSICGQALDWNAHPTEKGGVEE